MASTSPASTSAGGNNGEHHEHKLLPAPDDASTAKEEEVTTVQVNGQAVTLDKLGPLVVNSDGTLSRIANWQEMTEFERQNTLRVLSKRNQLRTSMLKEKIGIENEEGEKK